MTQAITLLLCVFYISYGKYHTWWATTHFHWGALDVSPDNQEAATTEGTPDDEVAEDAAGGDDAAAETEEAPAGFF